MLKLQIVTNNPEVEVLHGTSDRLLISYYDEDLLSILKRVRDLVHAHHRLLTHPLSGSVKPNETPYKSVALYADPHDQIDMPSLRIIEAALRLTEVLLQGRPLPAWNASVLQDFALIDASLLKSGLDSVSHF